MKPGARPCLLIGSRCWETPPLARSGESPDWLACLALGFHSQKSMKQRERGGGGGRGVRTGGRASEWGGSESRGRGGEGNAPISSSPGLLTTVGGAWKTSRCAGDPGGPGPPRSGLTPSPSGVYAPNLPRGVPALTLRPQVRLQEKISPYLAPTLLHCRRLRRFQGWMELGCGWGVGRRRGDWTQGLEGGARMGQDPPSELERTRTHTCSHTHVLCN